jgi:hypothetical protein
MKRAPGIILIIIAMVGSCSSSAKVLRERQAKRAKGPLTAEELGELIGSVTFGITVFGLGVWVYVVGAREEDETRRRDLDAALQADKERELLNKPKTAGGGAGEQQEAITAARPAPHARSEEKNKICPNCGKMLSIYAVKCRHCKKDCG